MNPLAAAVALSPRPYPAIYAAKGGLSPTQMCRCGRGIHLGYLSIATGEPDALDGDCAQ